MQKGASFKILDSAEEMLWHRGYQGSSLDRIANGAGQSKGSVFHYFRSKSDIAQQVLHKYAEEELFGTLQTQMATKPNVKEALLGWVEGFYNTYSGQGYKGGCLLGNMALELADQDEALRSELAKIFLTLENQLVGFLKEKCEAGDLVMENRQFARLLIAALQGVTMTIKVHKDKNRAAREFQALGEMIERLVKG